MNIIDLINNTRNINTLTFSFSPLYRAIYYSKYVYMCILRSNNYDTIIYVVLRTISIFTQHLILILDISYVFSYYCITFVYFNKNILYNIGDKTPPCFTPLDMLHGYVNILFLLICICCLAHIFIINPNAVYFNYV